MRFAPSVLPLVGLALHFVMSGSIVGPLATACLMDMTAHQALWLAGEHEDSGRVRQTPKCRQGQSGAD